MIAEHSIPSLDIATQKQFDLDTNTRSQIFDSLQEGREYNVSVAGKVGGRAGVLGTLCIRTRETGSSHETMSIILQAFFTIFSPNFLDNYDFDSNHA